jgi:hypothetical protein
LHQNWSFLPGSTQKIEGVDVQTGQFLGKERLLNHHTRQSVGKLEPESPLPTSSGLVAPLKSQPKW